MISEGIQESQPRAPRAIIVSTCPKHREILLGERHPQTDLAATGRAFSEHLVAVRDLARKAAVWRRKPLPEPESP